MSNLAKSGVNDVLRRNYFVDPIFVIIENVLDLLLV